MKRILTLAMAAALLILTLAACSKPPEETTTEPPSTTEAATTEPATEPPRRQVTAQDITVSATPVAITERPEFSVRDHITDAELVSLHGYSIGMTFAQTQAIWPIPEDMVAYAAGKLESGELTSLYIYIGNMAYDFVRPAGGSSADFSGYVLSQFYYGENEFCTERESLSVLRGIKLGDMIGDALALLPGARKPRQWAIDQLYGEYGKPMSASLEYTIRTGFYDLRVYGETAWIQMIFGSSGKLWYADVRSINE